MYFTLIFYFIRSLLLFLLFKFLSIIKISSILSCSSSHFTLLNGVIPVFFELSIVGKYSIILQLWYSNFLYKIPGYVNIISYLLLRNNKAIKIKTIKILIIILFVLFLFLFTFVYKNTIFYTIPWLLCIIYLFINIKKISFFDAVFISNWLAHAFGTIIYGFLNGFLSCKMYLYLLPISILERSLFIVATILLFYSINFFDFQLKKIFEIIFKKKLILKL